MTVAMATRKQTFQTHPRRWFTASLCPDTGKVRYRTEKSATAAISYIQEVAAPKHLESRYYLCQFCHAYHLTSQPDRRTPPHAHR